MKISQGNICIAVLNKQKCNFFFTKTEQEGGISPGWGSCYQWEEGGDWKRV
jgi:hypothetical protein